MDRGERKAPNSGQMLGDVVDPFDPPAVGGQVNFGDRKIVDEMAQSRISRTPQGALHLRQDRPEMGHGDDIAVRVQLIDPVDAGGHPGRRRVPASEK